MKMIWITLILSVVIFTAQTSMQETLQGCEVKSQIYENPITGDSLEFLAFMSNKKLPLRILNYCTDKSIYISIQASNLNIQTYRRRLIKESNHKINSSGIYESWTGFKLGFQNNRISLISGTSELWLPQDLDLSCAIKKVGVYNGHFAQCTTGHFNWHVEADKQVKIPIKGIDHMELYSNQSFSPSIRVGGTEMVVGILSPGTYQLVVNTQDKDHALAIMDESKIIESTNLPKASNTIDVRARYNESFNIVQYLEYEFPMNSYDEGSVIDQNSTKDMVFKDLFQMFIYFTLIGVMLAALLALFKLIYACLTGCKSQEKEKYEGIDLSEVSSVS